MTQPAQADEQLRGLPLLERIQPRKHFSAIGFSRLLPHLPVTPAGSPLYENSIGFGKSMICALCSENRVLRESHIIPQFVAKWLKDTSATGYLRQAVMSNLRKEDFPKQKLLCDECETRLSRWETQFSQSIFLPYWNGKTEFAYDNWLLKFAVSLIWRSGIVQLESFRQYKPNLVHHLEHALPVWKGFLLDKVSSPEPYTHHLLFMDFVENVEGGSLPDGFHWYTLRSIDTIIPASSKEVYGYVKLPAMVFFTGIYPNRLSGWKNTRIFMRGKISASKQRVSHETFGEFYLDRVQQAERLAEMTSSRQREKIAVAIKSNPQRSVQSRSFQVFIAEQIWKRKQKKHANIG